MSSRPHAEPPESLDPLCFPLHGSRLIEASAGTGKTFTIALLYVRLVLGHGDTNAHPRALTPPEILVLSFTEAATQELRDRIRLRLVEAAQVFRIGAESDAECDADADAGTDPDAAPDATLPPADADNPLHALRAHYPPAQRPALARRLQMAAEWMDEAAISTIHGWCHRMLREHAFDSGTLFSQTLETDQQALFDEAVRDYWRLFMAPLDLPLATVVTRSFRSPRELAEQIRPLIRDLDQLPPAAEPATLLRDWQNDHTQALERLKAPWRDWLEQLRDLFAQAREAGKLNGRQLTQKNLDGWLGKLATWRDDPSLIDPELSPTALRRFSPTGMTEVWKDGAPPGHPALVALGELKDALAALPTPRSGLLGHATRWIVERFALEQARRAQMGLDDLLSRLDTALQGSHGERLAGLIRAQFPVAMIDEFQDTDPLQYRIFDAVYRVSDNDPETALVLIGDPKQAIYGFRGADIHAYLRARAACAGRLHTLKRNFRATGEMVAATNRCFEVAETRPQGAGAFLFRQGPQNPVPFVNASAKGRAATFEADGDAVTALTFWWLPPGPDGKALGKADFLARMAAACATEMVRLLTLGQAGAAGFRASDSLEALRPADLAVLVNNGTEAAAIRLALEQRGVRSVYLSDRHSVYASEQAAELQHWLAACAEPGDAGRLRAALATPTLGLSLSELDALNHDDNAWDRRVVQFHQYQHCWQRQGVLPMVRRLLTDFSVPGRLLAGDLRVSPADSEGRDADGDADGEHDGDADDAAAGGPVSGERILTNLLHLAELLQGDSVLFDGEHALMRHLAEQRAQAGQGSDNAAQQLRLESDADLVKVVTVHKSKGLEYPLVFLPFASCCRPVTKAPLRWHADGRTHLALEATPEAIRLADHERLGEDLRKLYVALTRARHATWVGVAALNKQEKSAINYLLSAEDPIAPEALEARLLALRGDCDAIRIAPAPAADDRRLSGAGARVLPGPAREPSRPAHEHWWIASYSALRTAGASGREVAETASEEKFQEARQAELLAPDVLQSEPVRPDLLTPDVRQAALPAPAQPLAAAATVAHAAVAHAAGAPYAEGTSALPPDAHAWHRFERGAQAGSFLHDVLEWVAAQGFAAVAADPGPLRDLIARRCRLRGWTQWIEPLTGWVSQLLTTRFRLPPLDGQPPTEFSLATLPRAIAEMEFWLSARSVDTRVLDARVCALTLDGAPRPALLPAQVNGMLKGFIDLVFEHQGRFYVVDYKSNWLGPNDGAYTPQAQSAAVLKARYELQYVLYLFALHRLLRSRLPDYDYDRHVGGAVYLFLRGLNSPGQGVHAERPPRALIDSLDELFAGSTALDGHGS
jgi:exodeoxyribonuclease V beta subunit